MFLPVVERELRVASRRRGTYRLRFYSVLALLAVLCFNLVGARFHPLPSSQLGSQLFFALTLAAFIFSIMTGVIATSDCVSKEKREGTLGLLFLTDLKGYDVVHGKLTAGSLHAFYALIGILPLLGIPLLMGGITAPQFLRVSLALLTTLIFSLTVGIFISAHSRDERKAIVFTFLILAVVTVAPFIVFFSQLQGSTQSPQSDSWWLLFCSPGFAVLMAEGQIPLWPPSAYWWSLTWLWAMSACLLSWTSVRLPLMSGDAENSGFAEFRRKLETRFRLGSGPSRHFMDINPFFWLAMRGEASRWRVWFFVFSVLCIWLAFGRTLKGFMFDWAIISMVVGVLHLVLKIWITAEASRRFVEDRKANTFELILSTPSSAGEIIQGQWLALWKQFGGVLIALLVVQMALILRGMQYFQVVNSGDRFPLYLTGMFFLITDAAALSWLGMWFGLKSKTRIQAILSGLVLVLLSRMLIVRAVMSLTDDFPHLELPRLQAVLTFCVGAAIDLPVIIFARSSLLRNFRKLATAQVNAKKSNTT